jgi:hypothetical protein
MPKIMTEFYSFLFSENHPPALLRSWIQRLAIHMMQAVGAHLIVD